jgi:hypothetical protein
MLRIPSLLEDLIAAGRWPRTAREQLAQNLRPLVSPERVKRLVPDERGIIYLAAPPFRAAGRRADPKDFYNSPSSDPGGIDLDRAIIIGDFGIGSDAPIALDYREDATNPRVIRLRYNEDCPPLAGRWVLLAPDFPSFVSALGL